MDVQENLKTGKYAPCGEIAQQAVLRALRADLEEQYNTTTHMKDNEVWDKTIYMVKKYCLYHDEQQFHIAICDMYKDLVDLLER